MAQVPNKTTTVKPETITVKLDDVTKSTEASVRVKLPENDTGFTVANTKQLDSPDLAYIVSLTSAYITGTKMNRHEAIAAAIQTLKNIRSSLS